MIKHLRKLVAGFLLGTLLFVLAADAITQSSNQPADTQLVNITLTVTDRNDSPVPNLAKEDVRVSDDDDPQQIISLERQVDIPLSLSILIDMSGSQEYALPNTKALAAALVDSALRQGRDAATLSTFTGEMSVQQPLTDDLQQVKAAIQRLKFVPPPQNGSRGKTVSPTLSKQLDATASTAIWDAVYEACERMPGGSAVSTRRVILLMTDGVDTSSRRKLNDAIRLAAKSGIVVYIVGIGDDYNFDGVDKTGLRKLSERTGGQAFFPTNTKGLQETLSGITQRLQAQYVLTYRSTNTKPSDLYRRLRIIVTNSDKKKSKLELAYPDGYFPG